MKKSFEKRSPTSPRIILCSLRAVPCSPHPVPYSGKVAINGANFQGDAPFTFALRDADGTVHWRNGVDADSSVTLNVDRGLYICLLGGQHDERFPHRISFSKIPHFF